MTYAQQIVFESFNKHNIINRRIRMNTYLIHSYSSSFLFLQKWRFHHGRKSDIGAYTFLLSCVASSYCPGTMIGICFLLLKTSTTRIILFFGTQIFLGPFLLSLNALDAPILGRCMHMDAMFYNRSNNNSVFIMNINLSLISITSFVWGTWWAKLTHQIGHTLTPLTSAIAISSWLTKLKIIWNLGVRCIKL